MRVSTKRLARIGAAAAVLVLGGCVVIPQGPSQHALPGSRMSFDQFAADDASCRQYASAQVGGNDAVRNANDAAVGSALAGAVIGAAAGGLLGGHGGAGVGAGVGLITGSAIGAGAAQASYYGTQHRFDGAYHQCMYARGHRVPSSGALTQAPRRAPPSYSPPSYPPPNAPPPAGYPAVPPPNAPPPYGYPAPR